MEIKSVKRIDSNQYLINEVHTVPRDNYIEELVKNFIDSGGTVSEFVPQVNRASDLSELIYNSKKSVKSKKLQSHGGMWSWDTETIAKLSNTISIGEDPIALYDAKYKEISVGKSDAELLIKKLKKIGRKNFIFWLEINSGIVPNKEINDSEFKEYKQTISEHIVNITNA